VEELDEAEPADIVGLRRAGALARELRHYIELAKRVISQTRRRVFDGQTVPAGEKLVSLFEPHADILVKGGRQQERADPRCRH